MSKSMKVVFFHQSVLQTFPQFPSMPEETVASAITAWLVRQCKFEVDPLDFDTVSAFNPDALCFPTPVAVQGSSRAATKPLAIARMLKAVKLLQPDEADAFERKARAANHMFLGAGSTFVHFVLFKPFDLLHFLRWAVPFNCGPSDLLCVVYKDLKTVQAPFQPLGCAHTEMCSNEDDTFLERVTADHLTKCLLHTGQTRATPEQKLRERGGAMDEANMVQTISFFNDAKQVDQVSRNHIPIETWAAFHPLFQHATYNSSTSLVLNVKEISRFLPKELKKLLPTIVAANPAAHEEWRLAQVQVSKLTSFLKDALVHAQGVWSSQGWDMRPFGGFAQWNELELAHAFANLPAPERSEPAKTPQQAALDFAFITVPSSCTRFVKNKSSATLMRIGSHPQMMGFYAYYCGERAGLMNAPQDWRKCHKIYDDKVGGGCKIGSFAELELFFGLLSREVGCDCATLASLVPVTNLDSASFEEMSDGLPCV